MKIALYNLTTTTKSGGIETFNWEIARALAKRGYKVDIYGGKGKTIWDIPQNVSLYTYPYIRRNIFPDFGTRFRKFTERLSFGIIALRHLIKRKYDYIYISKPFDIPIALLSSSRTGAKVIFGSGGTEFFPGYKYLVKKLDYFFACSEFNASQIEKYCGMRPLVLPNGINTELFKPLNQDKTLKRTLRLDENDTVIVSTCRLIGLKGICYAIKAIEKIIKKNRTLKYLIIGDGEDKKNLQILSDRLKLKDNIIFVGDINNSELPKYYSCAHIAVFPSIADETFGISIAEAMACGVPVISTKVGGIPEVVAKDTGVLIPPKDEHALAEKIEMLLSNEALREYISIRGREQIVNNFSWDKIVEKFETYLKDA